MTSLSVSMRLMTRASCETEWTWSVAVTTAVWSGVTPTWAATMLTLFSATTWVMSREQAGPVVGLDPDRDRVGLGRLGLPLDLDEAADLALVDDGRAGLEVDRHALAAGDEPDDRVARDRVAALGEADEQVADALDPDAAGPGDLLGRRDRSGACSGRRRRRRGA